MQICKYGKNKTFVLFHHNLMFKKLIVTSKETNAHAKYAINFL